MNIIFVDIVLIAVETEFLFFLKYTQPKVGNPAPKVTEENKTHKNKLLFLQAFSVFACLLKLLTRNHVASVVSWYGALIWNRDHQVIWEVVSFIEQRGYQENWVLFSALPLAFCGILAWHFSASLSPGVKYYPLGNALKSSSEELSKLDYSIQPTDWKA